MTIKKTESGWRVDIQPGGRTGRRISKTLPTKGEALAWETWAKSQALKAPEWAPERADHRPLSELIAIWWKTHGSEQKAGLDTKKRLEALAEALGNPGAAKLTSALFAEYRAKRLAEGTAGKNTLNREHAYLKSAINHLKRLGEWRGENPLEKVKQFKIDQTELSYLEDEEIDRLLAALEQSTNRHALTCTKLVLATGLRWTEAESLEVSQIRGNLVTVTGKNFKQRSLPICDELAAEMLAHHKPEETGSRLFGSCYGAFRSGIKKAGVQLPDGQLAHVTRHTFASHFLKNGGSILTLQRALDHSDLKVTMRYSHLAPDHLEQVLSHNPLARLYRQQSSTDPQRNSEKTP